MRKYFTKSEKNFSLRQLREYLWQEKKIKLIEFMRDAKISGREISKE